MKKVVFIKIGGSLIADKSQRYLFEKEKVLKIAEVLRNFKKEKSEISLIIGNGAGSFGHYSAKKYGLDKKIRSEDQIFGAAFTHNKVVDLNQKVVKILLEFGLRVFSFAPSSFLVNDIKPYAFFLPVYEALENNLDISVYGDVVFDKKGRIKIFSTEDIFAVLLDNFLKNKFQVLKIIHISKEKGVLDDKGEIIPEIIRKSYPKIKEHFFKSKLDVTGGMEKKVVEALKFAGCGIETIICSLNQFEPALFDQDFVGTRIF